MGVRNRNKSDHSEDPLAGTVTPDEVHVEIEQPAGSLAAQLAIKAQQPPEESFGAAITEIQQAPLPDAGNLKHADFPERQPPKVIGTRDRGYQIIYKQSVLDQIHDHGKQHPEVEVCGVLIGNVYQDGAAPYAYIEAAIRGNDAVTRQTQVTITSQTWSRIHETLEKEHPDKCIIGWYHTHPGFGVFLSGMDLFIQENFFNAPWQVAFVYDPLGGDEAVFVWRDGKALREPHLIEDDTGLANLPGGYAAAIVVAELTERVCSLESKVTWLTTGVVMLIAVALLWPMVLVTFFPQTLRNLMDNGDDPVPASLPHSQAAKPGPATLSGPSIAAKSNGQPDGTAQTKVALQGTNVAGISIKSENDPTNYDTAAPASGKIIMPGRASTDKTAVNGRPSGPKILTISPEEWAPARRPKQQ